MSGTLGQHSVNTIPRQGYQVLANLADARFKHGGGILDFSGVSAVGGQNTIGTITINATGGTFTISYGGQTTGALAYNASAATVEAALEGLSSIGNGNIQVGGADGGPFTYEFIEDLRHSVTTAVTTNAGSLTGGAGTATVATTQVGAADADVTLAGGQVVKIGDKYIPAGTVVYRTGGKFAPAATGTTLTRGDVFVTNRHVVYSELGSEAAAGLFDGGTVWFSRLQIGGTGQPTEANFLAAFPGINLIRD